MFFVQKRQIRFLQQQKNDINQGKKLLPTG